MSGSVVDRTGAPVAGATVRVSGDALPVARTVLTSERGVFIFLVPPGEYRIEVEKSTLGTTSRAILVEPGRETRADFILGALVAEPVAVTAAAPDVNMKSAEVSFTYNRALVQDLPLDRSYLGLMQLIPGVAENNGFAPNGGGSRQDNTFLVDSVNITNPFFGYLSTEINELDIAGIDVKRGALRPESGRSIGLTSNAVIKSGTNVFTGDYRFEAIPSQLVTRSSKVVRSRTDRWDHAFDAGGPIIKNRIFFYGSGRVFRSSSPDASNIFGAIPNRKEKTEEYFGKVTARAGAHVISASYRHRPRRIDFDGIGAYDEPDVAWNVKGTNRIGHVYDDWFIRSRTIVSASFVHVEEDTESVAVRHLGFLPPFDPLNVINLGRFTLNGIAVGAASLELNRQDYTRDELRVVLSQAVDTPRVSHQIKAGFGWDQGVEDLIRRTNGWGDLSFVSVGGLARVRATYYPEQPAQRSTGRTYSMFVQDDLTFASRITVNAGLLLNRDEFVQRATGQSSAVFPAFGFADQMQPRLGVNLGVRKKAGDKVYANWARYDGLDQKSSARAVASGRLYTVDTDFDQITGAVLAQAVSANTGAKTVAAGITPPVTNESVLGYATPIGGVWSLDAFVLARRSHDFIEDVPTVLPFSSFQFQNDPFAVRKYRTVTVELKRRLQHAWSLNMSYAWSRLSGNYDLDYSADPSGTGFNTASLVDDGPGAFTTDRFRSGVLSQDRTHVYKVFATWNPARVDGLSLGVFVRGQSGTPWEARGLPWDSGVTYLRLLEPAGSHRTPFWTNVDALVKYGVAFSARRKLRFEGRILNLFNQETTLLVDQRKYLDPRHLDIVGTPSPGCWSCYTDAFVQGQEQVASNFGQPIAFARPRRLLLSVLFDF